MWAGTAKRSGVVERVRKSWLDAPRPPSTVISFEWLVVVVHTQSVVRPRAGFRTSPKRVSLWIREDDMLRLLCVRAE